MNPDTTEPTKEYRKLLFGVRRSVRYHSRRRQHYELFHKTVLFLALILGSITVAAFAEAIGNTWPAWVKALPAALVSILAALDLVLGSSAKSWQHADLARRFIDLERELETRKGEPLNTLISEITDKRLEIETSEPPVLRVLDTICHNELLRAMGYDRKEEVKVSLIQRLCAPVCDVAEWSLYPRNIKG